MGPLYPAAEDPCPLFSFIDWLKRLGTLSLTVSRVLVAYRAALRCDTRVSYELDP